MYIYFYFHIILNDSGNQRSSSLLVAPNLDFPPLRKQKLSLD
nr:MAG TPA: hypothetical protein [Caudoviricetes sp.]